MSGSLLRVTRYLGDTLVPFSKCWPKFNISTNFQNVDQISKFWPNFKISTKFQNFKILPNFPKCIFSKCVPSKFIFPKCIFFPACIYPKCIFARCTRLACLLSFASLFIISTLQCKIQWEIYHFLSGYKFWVECPTEVLPLKGQRS